MRKLFNILILVAGFFTVEFLLFNIFGRWLTPSLLVLLIVFIDFRFGIRFSLFTAVAAGILSDSYGLSYFGINILAYCAVACVSMFARRYAYHAGSRTNRYAIVMIALVTHFSIRMLLQVFMEPVPVVQALRFILVPQMVATLVICNFVLELLRKCASKLFVF